MSRGDDLNARAGSLLAEGERLLSAAGTQEPAARCARRLARSSVGATPSAQAMPK